MSIRDWPPLERPREKLLDQGAASLSNAELLAIFLHTGTRERTALDLARDLLQAHDGLRRLLDGGKDNLLLQPGLGPARSALLLAALELAQRYQAETLWRQDVLSCPTDTCRFLQARLRSRPQEIFCVLFLDNRHRVIAFEELFTGTIDGASVHPREVLRRVMAHNAAAVILAHNHPSGVAEPSQADCRITRRLQDALALIDVRVLDHVVIGDGSAVSLAERGII
jgi:DNA repair protein RadC